MQYSKATIGHPLPSNVLILFILSHAILHYTDGNLRVCRSSFYASSCPSFQSVTLLYLSHISHFIIILCFFQPLPMAARSKAWVYGHLLAGIAGSIPAGGHWCLPLVNIVCCQVEFIATDRSLFQRSPTDCGVSECDRGTSWRRHKGQ
jgi:hypothetical protein